MMIKQKKQKGITLIALVITIIVLLILAGISIAALTGDNGVLTKASTSKIVNELGKAKDEINLKAAEAISDYYESIYVNNTSSPHNNGDMENVIINKLEKYFITDHNNGDYPDYTITRNDKKMIIVSKANPNIKTEVELKYGNGSLTWNDSFAGTPTTPSNCEYYLENGYHNFCNDDGICETCGYHCRHENSFIGSESNFICEECHLQCSHNGDFNNGICSGCGTTCYDLTMHNDGSDPPDNVTRFR